MGKIKKNDLLKMKFLSNLSISPDNKYLAVSVSQVDSETKGYESNIHIYDIEQNKWGQYTGSGLDNSFIWDMNLPIIYINSLRDVKDKEKRKNGYEISSIYQLDLFKGEAIKKYIIPKNIKSFKQISEFKFIFSADYVLGTKDFYLLSDEEKELEVKKRKDKDGFEIIENLPFWENGSGFIHNTITKIYTYDAENDKIKNISDILGDDIDVYDFQLDPTKSKVVVIYGTKLGKMDLKNKLAIIDIENKKVILNYTDKKYNISSAFMFDENNLIVSAAAMEKYGINENPKFYKVNFDTLDFECLNSDFDMSLWNSVGTDIRLYSSENLKQINNKLYFISTVGYSSNIFELDLKGNLKQLTNNTGSVDEYVVTDKGIFFIGLRNMVPQEIYRVSDSEEKISNFNDYISEKREIIYPNHFCVKDSDNYSIDYWVMKPYKFKADKKYPLILDIHGGPKTVYGEVYYHEMQYWAAEGFAVLFCNPRGSDGKGDEFADIRGEYGKVDYDNIMLCLNQAIKTNPFIDTDKMYVTGGSYGGFMTNWIIGHTDIFKAAATQRSISSWTSMYGTTDIGYYFATDQTASDPWNSYDKMWSQSPMKFYNNIKTPTLIVHSDQDYRCWLSEALQLFTSLKHNDVDSKLVIFKNENHELTRSGRPDNRIKNLEEITEWFKKYL